MKSKIFIFTVLLSVSLPIIASLNEDEANEESLSVYSLQKNFNPEELEREMAEELNIFIKTEDEVNLTQSGIERAPAVIPSTDEDILFDFNSSTEAPKKRRVRSR
jgi:hypothetical protein